MKLFKRIMLVFVIALSLTLVACCPKDADSAKSKMEKEGYSVVVDTKIQPAALKLAGIDGVSSVVTCSKEGEMLFAYYFASSNAAKDAMAKLTEDKKDDKNNESGLIRSGACIYFGSDKAVDDFK